MASVTINGNTYTDDASPATGLGGGGHRARFIPLISDVVTVTGAAAALNATPVSAFAWTLLDDTTAGGMRATLEAAPLSNPTFVPSSADTAALVRAAPSGSGSRSDLNLYGSSDTANSAYLALAGLPTLASIAANKSGSGSYVPLYFYTSEVIRLCLGVNGAVMVNSTTDDATGAKLQVQGDINLRSGFILRINGQQIIGARQAAIASAKVDYTTGNLDTEAEIITALNTTNGKINSILTALRNHGLIAP